MWAVDFAQEVSNHVRSSLIKRFGTSRERLSAFPCTRVRAPFGARGAAGEQQSSGSGTNVTSSSEFILKTPSTVQALWQGEFAVRESCDLVYPA